MSAVSERTLRGLVGTWCAVLALVLSPLATPDASAAAAWQGTSASAMRVYADRLVANVNKRRADHGLRPLRLATCIDRFSARWADHLDDTDTFEHADMGRLMNRCDLRYAAENLAGWSGSYSPAGVVGLWMNSPGHRANILSAKARRVGVTVFWDASRKSFYAVMEFGRFRG